MQALSLALLVLRERSFSILIGSGGDASCGLYRSVRGDLVSVSSSDRVVMQGNHPKRLEIHRRVSVSSSDRVVMQGSKSLRHPVSRLVSVSSSDRVVMQAYRPENSPPPNQVSVSSSDRVVMQVGACSKFGACSKLFQYPHRIGW